jgi:hypothetical protein
VATEKRRMSLQEFEAVLPLIKKISDQRREAAKAALVDGMSLATVAEAFGWSRQAVNDAIGQVWAARERYHESQRANAQASVLLPPGWEQVTLIAPSHMIERFRADIAKTSTEAPEPQPEPEPKTKRKKSPATQGAPGIKST